MKSFLALIKKDLKGYFDQPTGYILLVLFTGVMSYVFFFVTQFNATSEASIRNLFDVLPWMLAVFVPASTMRLLAEEQRDGTLEILLTQPIQGWIVLVTKFVSGLIFVNIAVLATLSVPLSLQTAGSLDWGAIAAQYLGGFFLIAAFVAIGLFTSSLTRNQIVAFIVGLFFNMALMVIGLDRVAITLPSSIATLLQSLSPVTHFSTIARGVINLRDILYFIGLVSTFLSASFLIIRGKTLSHQTVQYRNLQLGVAGLIVLSLLVGWFGNSIQGRLDLTEHKIYTLSEGTKEIVSELNDLLTVEIYESRDQPVELSLVSRDINDFLEDFEANSDGNVKIVHRYPEDDEEDARRAQIAGIPPQRFNSLSQGEFQISTGYLGIVMTYADQRESMPVIRSLDGFEYRLATLANKMVSSEEDRRTIAFLTGHGEKTIGQNMQSFATLLAEQYNVIEVESTEEEPAQLDGVDALIIPGPTQRMPDTTYQALQDYVQGGGKVMALIDPLEIDRQRFVPVPNQHNFSDFVEHYGVVVEDNLAFDMRSNETLSFNTQMGSVMLSYPYWTRARTVDTAVTGDVQTVIMPWPSSLGISESEFGRIEAIPLVSTTEFGGVDYTLNDVSPNSAALQDVTSGQLFQADLGFAIEGASPTGEEADSFRLVVFGDSDWLTDQIVNRNLDNLFLGLNLVDWLAQDDTLADIRSKVVSTRTLVFESDTHRNLVQYANIGGVPFIFVIIGVVQYVRRRRSSMRMYQ